MILVVKHISIEGAGTLGEYLINNGRRIKTIELDKGDNLPASLKGIEAIVLLGGPMNVYEQDKYPFLKGEDILLKKALKERIPILGICLGAQLLAKALGAKVKKARQKEIGWYKLNLTKQGKKDILFKGIGKDFDVFQWHEDTFDIPENATLLATTKTCKNQAFKYGDNAYGLQFHIEVTFDMIKNWIKEYTAEDKNMMCDYKNIEDEFKSSAYKIYRGFF